jgi:hypothetical protein
MAQRKSSKSRPRTSNTRPPNVTDGTSPRVDSTGAPRIVGCNVDTVYLSTTAIVASELALLYRQLKSAAQSDSREGPAPTLELAGHRFTVGQFGAKGAPFVLSSGDLVLKINPFAVGEFPTAMIEVHALPLWKLGAEAAIASAEAAMAAAVWDSNRGTPPPVRAQISRIDLAVDFQGVSPTLADFPRFVTRANHIDTHSVQGHFTGYSFGRGEIHARLYDKTAELLVSGKSWFREVWRASGNFIESEPVWRLEFQLRRAAFRRLRRKSDSARIDTWAELLPNVHTLWKRLCTEWLSMRLPRTNKVRKRLWPWWSALASQGFAGPLWDGSDAELIRIANEDSLKRTTPQLVAFLVREMADEQHKHDDQRVYGGSLTFDELASRALNRAARCATQKGRSIASRVDEAAETLNVRAETFRRLRRESRRAARSAQDSNAIETSRVALREQGGPESLDASGVHTVTPSNATVQEPSSAPNHTESEREKPETPVETPRTAIADASNAREATPADAIEVLSGVARDEETRR